MLLARRQNPVSTQRVVASNSSSFKVLPTVFLCYVIIDNDLREKKKKKGKEKGRKKKLHGVYIWQASRSNCFRSRIYTCQHRPHARFGHRLAR